MNDGHNRLCGLLMRYLRMHRRVVEGRIRSLDIHPSQHFLLMQLSSAGPMPSQAQLAEMMDVSPASVARTLKKLDESGYIRRSDSCADSRRNEIEITPKGEAVVSASGRIFRTVDEAVYGDFSPEELRCLEGLLKKMIGNLSELEQSERKEMKAT